MTDAPACTCVYERDLPQKHRRVCPVHDVIPPADPPASPAASQAVEQDIRNIEEVLQAQERDGRIVTLVPCDVLRRVLAALASAERASREAQEAHYDKPWFRQLHEQLSYAEMLQQPYVETPVKVADLRSALGELHAIQAQLDTLRAELAEGAAALAAFRAWLEENFPARTVLAKFDELFPDVKW